MCCVTLALGAASGAQAQKSGGILRMYFQDSPPSASIHEEATTSTVVPFMGLYNNLVLFDQLKPQNSLETIKPDLAESWTVNGDGTQLTFKLRQGVVWHDGKPFTSADVKCTWDMLKGEGERKLRRNPRTSWYVNLDKVTTNGDFEATFHLKQPQPSFLVLLASERLDALVGDGDGFFLRGFELGLLWLSERAPAGEGDREREGGDPRTMHEGAPKKPHRHPRRVLKRLSHGALAGERSRDTLAESPRLRACSPPAARAARQRAAFALSASCHDHP